MQKARRQNSIVSYAGLPKGPLFALAKQAFAQADFEVPERFSSFVPLFPFELIQNMDYIGTAGGSGARVALSGFSIDPIEYHRKLYEQMPDLYAEDNRARNFDYEGRFQGRGVFTVDKAWAMHFPQYQPFLGEKLHIYLIGGGHQAVAVPESVYPRGGGILARAEKNLQITQRVEQYVQYARGRVAAGDSYQAESFAEEFLGITGLEPVTITQAEMGRMLQDLSIAKSLQSDAPGAGLFTESAKRVEHLRQYIPDLYACDTFDPAPVTRHTARLTQPCFLGSDFISDLWIPYQDLNGYVDKQRMALDMARLCEGYQIAPAYDPETGGGRYPDALRAVVVRDREVPMMMGDVLNNPAYGGGMNPLGMIGQHVFLPDSRELIRQRKLAVEEMELTVENTAVSSENFRRSHAMAALQETKGRLVDAMYRREAALSQMAEGSRAYEKARALLNEKVSALESQVERESAKWRHGQVSGYDADIDYLRRKRLAREGMPDEEQREPILFAVDAQREQSIESGYAMRNNLQRMSYVEAYVPELAEEQAEPAEEAPHREGAAPMEKPPEAAVSEMAESEIEEADTPVENPAEEELSRTEQENLPDESGETEDVAPAQEADPGRPKKHAPATFADLKPGPGDEKREAAPKLAYIVRRESEQPVKVVHKDGKMASLLHKKQGEQEKKT